MAGNGDLRVLLFFRKCCPALQKSNKVGWEEGMEGRGMSVNSQSHLLPLATNVTAESSGWGFYSCLMCSFPPGQC